MSRKPVTCPRCGASGPIPVVYGMPTYDLFVQSEQGKVKLMGCCVTPNDPDWFCPSCEFEWRKKDPFAGLQKIEIGVGGYFGPSYTVEIEFDQRNISWCEYWLQSPEEEGINGRRKLEDLEFEDFLAMLEIMAPHRWAEQYVNPSVSDGTSWDFIMTYHQREVTKSGSNKFPPGWKVLCSEIASLTGLDFN